VGKKNPKGRRQHLQGVREQEKKIKKRKEKKRRLRQTDKPGTIKTFTAKPKKNKTKNKKKTKKTTQKHKKKKKNEKGTRRGKKGKKKTKKNTTTPKNQRCYLKLRTNFKGGKRRKCEKESKRGSY